MFARLVNMRLKHNVVYEFNMTMERDVLPLLRKQKGFRDELTLVASNGIDVVKVSLWDRRQDAENYDCEAYTQVQEMLSEVTEGTPQVQNYDVSLSTAHETIAQPA